MICINLQILLFVNFGHDFFLICSLIISLMIIFRNSLTLFFCIIRCCHIIRCCYIFSCNLRFLRFCWSCWLRFSGSCRWLTCCCCSRFWSRCRRTTRISRLSCSTHASCSFCSIPLIMNPKLFCCPRSWDHDIIRVILIIVYFTSWSSHCNLFSIYICIFAVNSHFNCCAVTAQCKCISRIFIKNLWSFGLAKNPISGIHRIIIFINVSWHFCA